MQNCCPLTSAAGFYPRQNLAHRCANFFLIAPMRTGIWGGARGSAAVGVHRRRRGYAERRSRPAAYAGLRRAASVVHCSPGALAIDMREREE